MDDLSQPATKGDIVRIHAKLDMLLESVTDLKSKSHEQGACKALQSHLEEHKEVKSDVRKAVLPYVVQLVLAAIMAFGGYLLGRK